MQVHQRARRVADAQFQQPETGLGAQGRLAFKGRASGGDVARDGVEPRERGAGLTRAHRTPLAGPERQLRGGRRRRVSQLAARGVVVLHPHCDLAE